MEKADFESAQVTLGRFSPFITNLNVGMYNIEINIICLLLYYNRLLFIYLFT